MSTQVTVRFDITPEALQQHFPQAQSIRLNKSGKSATLEFASAADAKACGDVTSFVCPISQRQTTVYCSPDVTQQAVSDPSKLITFTDVQTSTGGRVYKNQNELPTKHIASLKFTPVVNSVILAPMDFGALQIQVVSIVVSPQQNDRFSIFMKVFHKESGRSGTCILKRSVDEQGQVKYSRRCFDLLVDKDSYKQADDAIIPVHFISIESITVDPETGLWSELKIALDQVDTKLSLFRLGSLNKSFQRRGGSGPRRQGGKSQAPRRRQGGAPRNIMSGAPRRAPQQRREPYSPKQDSAIAQESAPAA